MENTAENAALPSPDNAAEMTRQLAGIRELDPNMATLADVLKLDTADAFRSYVHRGLDWKDAFTLANRDRLLAEADERASLRQQQASKAHLQASTLRGGGGVRVPEQELRFYRELLPGLSEADYRRHYNEDRKQMRG